MKILVANHWLKKLGGSETFTYTLIGELVKQGHDVSYFTTQHGVVTGSIEKDYGVKYSQSGSYDLILASHNEYVRVDYPNLPWNNPETGAALELVGRICGHIKRGGTSPA